MSVSNENGNMGATASDVEVVQQFVEIAHEPVSRGVEKMKADVSEECEEVFS